MKFIVGKKIGMSQIFDTEGKVIPVTVIEAEPIFVTQIKTKEKDGYAGVQFGFGGKKSTNKAQKGHVKKAGLENSFAHFSEIRPSEKAENVEIGKKIDVSIFSEGEKVSVSGLTKAKGFQGVMKRHGFHGGSASHGQKHSAREPGSIGVGGVQRVIKGTRMAGRMGNAKRTIKNLKIVKIDAKNNMIALRGAVPGRKGTLLSIKSE